MEDMAGDGIVSMAASLLCAVATGAKRELPLVIAEMLGRVTVDLREVPPVP
jgi:hypothetical protein